MENFSNIIKSGQLVLVDFFATWCGPCKTMHPVLEQLKKDLGDEIRIIKVDVDKNEAIAIQLRIQSIPTLMIFKGGEMKWRQSGAMTANALAQVIAQYK
ncbi:thioredoxin [uncultured Prevotella sp.]|mgnify:CR=1 FL=1|uniref:thioredoxin n=1 Tax=uncultured Prevotella sp. TaxID=159272 RepID=UPI0026098928|nr:thioredoxin [uncultured Prevotella sp.]